MLIVVIIISLTVPFTESFTILGFSSAPSSVSWSKIPTIAALPNSCENGTSAIKFVSEEIKALFPSSSYYDNALLDLGEYYKINLAYDLARQNYNALIDVSENENLIADAYLSKGMIDFNVGNIENAIDEFLFVINNYQHTKYFRSLIWIKISLFFYCKNWWVYKSCWVFT